MKPALKAELLRELPGLQQDHLVGLTDYLGRDLVALLNESRQQQSQALNAAIEKAMHHVPMLLRGPLKKILFP